MNELSTPIGYIVGGSLKESFRVRLMIPAQNVQDGAFVVVESDELLFYGLVTDLQLGSTDPRFADEQSEQRLPEAVAGLLHGQTLYTNLEVLPALMLERGPDLDDPRYAQWQEEVDRGIRPKPRPLMVKTIPKHHAPVRMASPGDIAEIFGEPGEPGNFVIGYTREQGYPICLDLDKFVLRSSGVFGATGTGKSFLTRLVLAGLIHTNRASVLVLDMHNEYAFDDIASDSKERVIGLKNKFASRVRVVGLGKGTMIRNNPPDYHLEIACRDIQPEDIELLTRELNLKETTPTTLDALVNSFGRDRWFVAFSKMTNEYITDDKGVKSPAPGSVAHWANERGVNVSAAESLHSKLARVANLPYVVENPASDTINEIIKSLEAGQHIILSFGKSESDLDYLLVSNLLTRKIRQAWEARTNELRSSGKGEPRPLVIVVEEAHKLLNREMAGQTTFSTIAREMRKYFVTLMIVDQRPSQIYDEVMSQLGTRISGWLGDDDDIRAVLSGLAGREALRGMLAHLQPKEEVLLLGWGMPMPLPVRTRRYDNQFWEELLERVQTNTGHPKKPASSTSEADILTDLGF